MDHLSKNGKKSTFILRFFLLPLLLEVFCGKSPAEVAAALEGRTLTAARRSVTMGAQ
jgi:hypothetical protein